MEQLSCDLLVIGSGPSGQKAAMQAAKFGKSVIVVEKDEAPGGTSLYSGTIPSKSLREAVIDLTGLWKRSFYGSEALNREVSISDLYFRLNKVLEGQEKILTKQFKRNGIRVIHGFAKFENKHEVEVKNGDDSTLCHINAECILIATGSKPRNPNNVPFDDQQVLDSTRLLKIDKVPKRMVVLGGGVIGSEYASFFAMLGVDVVVVDKRDHMLPLLDREIGIHLQEGLTEIGLQFMPRKEVETIEREKEEVVVKFTDGTTLHADILLYALGRVANVDGMDIEKVGVSLDHTGHIPVNPLFQTIVPNIYAAGDVIGGPCLASTSMEQGRLAARHAFGGQSHYFPNLYPYGIYTIPEISYIGYSEEELKNLGFRYEVGRAYSYEIARNQIAGNDPGMFKILFHTDTLEILGIHIIGRGATEVIHIGQVAMTFNAKIDYFIDQVFNYPTYAEGYRIAALNGFNKVKHKR
ncbi:MAG: putative soluble pyridine nucleotide transhydrogenase [Chlamydiia bacterium]|nr:putative soluble pyridine nucleotide transhydrogenase [Chlamydiia bacterium]MCH9615146.1 putative soluble pyridine nucleotide transhydrogenase [Chlamydiia bacterium]MCH9628532.1 putative soluble pyridine nucleotide transhydrogenase [Chlamydiia bacterium]